MKKRALQSASEALEQSLQSAQERFKALSIDKESLQIGFAAGYTGRTLRDIEDSLMRIESTMLTKEFFTTEQQKFFPQIIEILNSIKQILEKHDSSAQERSEALQSALNRLEALWQTIPIHSKHEEAKEIPHQLLITPNMEKLLEFIKEKGEVSYNDIMQHFGYKSCSSVRGILSSIIKRTNCIQRFKKDGKGWVRYIPTSQPSNT